MMDTGAIALSWLDLSLAAALILFAGAVSIGLGLRLERRLALASVRTVVQLLLIGLVLRYVFGLEEWWAVILVLIFMTGMAARAAVQRPSRTFQGAAWRAFATLILCGLLTTFAVTSLVVGVEPWYKPQYVIPLLGMVLGNSLNGISLAIDQLLEILDERREVVEMELALGASKWEAARDPVAEAVRRGMIPIINSMMVVGIVSLPGMMTGQILEGADPFEAVKYQIVVMFMIAAATSLGCIGATLFAFKRLFNARHQLDSAAIRRRS